jgi:hypothetical protein
MFGLIRYFSSWADNTSVDYLRSILVISSCSVIDNVTVNSQQWIVWLKQKWAGFLIRSLSRIWRCTKSVNRAVQSLPRLSFQIARFFAQQRKVPTGDWGLQLRCQNMVFSFSTIYSFIWLPSWPLLLGVKVHSYHLAFYTRLHAGLDFALFLFLLGRICSEYCCSSIFCPILPCFYSRAVG